jgi:hypothetical protein
LLRAIREVQKGGTFFSPIIADRLRDRYRNQQNWRKSGEGYEARRRESERLGILSKALPKSAPYPPATETGFAGRSLARV